jgi:hypothetical protein
MHVDHFHPGSKTSLEALIFFNLQPQHALLGVSLLHLRPKSFLHINYSFCSPRLLMSASLTVAGQVTSTESVLQKSPLSFENEIIHSKVTGGYWDTSIPL